MSSSVRSVLVPRDTLTAFLRPHG